MLGRVLLLWVTKTIGEQRILYLYSFIVMGSVVYMNLARQSIKSCLLLFLAHINIQLGVYHLVCALYRRPRCCRLPRWSFPRPYFPRCHEHHQACSTTARLNRQHWFDIEYVHLFSYHIHRYTHIKHLANLLCNKASEL
jgi:hypothetical protein